MLSESFDLYLLQNTTSVTNVDAADNNTAAPSGIQTQKAGLDAKSSEDKYLEVDLSDDDTDVETEVESAQADIEAEDTDIDSDIQQNQNSDEDITDDVADNDKKTEIDNDENKHTVVDKDYSSSKEEQDDEDEGITLKEFKKLISSNSKNDEIAAEYGYDKLFDYMDENGDGKISDDEISALGFDINDIENLTADNIRQIAKLAGLPDIDEKGEVKKADEKEEKETLELTPELLEKLKKAFGITDDAETQTPQIEQTSPAAYNSGVSGGGGVSSSGGSSGSSGSSASKSAADTPQDMSMDQLLEEQQTKQTALDDANAKVAEVQSGENAEVKAAIDDADEKQEIYEKALEEDEEISDELKERQEKNQEAIEKQEDIISEKETAISEAEAQITNLDNDISMLDNKISALNASLSALPAKTEDNESRHAEIDAMEASIREQISAAESEKESKTDEKTKIEKQKETDEEDLKDAQDELKDLEDEREEIEKEILENCSDETKEALEAWQEARENIETVKQEQLSLAQKEVEKAQSELDEVNASIKELETMQIQLENRVGGEGEDVVDFATKLDGMSASEMKQIMQAAGCQFDDGAWCADFVTYVTKQIYGNDATPGDFANSCSNTAYCPTIGAWAEANGVLTTDSSQVQPGDFILYTKNGTYGHIGIVTSVNDDGTVNTVEGNTSYDNGSYNGGVVNQWTGRTGTYVLMHELA